ncbi:hypothetical protein EON79_07670 [bacterium]|nr:MAG: hypothetical protein EON79_07670 [bacterium]
MSLLTLAGALLAISAAPVEVNVNAKTGESITGERAFRVTVSAKNPVSQVEFYVGSDLRDKDTSTPYEFRLDTLAEGDGDLKIRFVAYTSAGEKGEKTITLKVDNGLGKGAAFHIERANTLLSDGKYADALVAGRIALKIDDKSVPARIALARANIGLAKYDSAQKFAEDALAISPDDAGALDLLSSIRIRQAFAITARGDQKKEDVLATQIASLKAAAESRRKVLDAAADRNEPTKDLVAYADAAIRAGRYTSVVSTLTPEVRKDGARTDLANRLAYAQLRSDRPVDANQTLSELAKFGKPDAYSKALHSVIYAVLGEDTKSDDALRDALLTDSNDLGVRTAQAYLALKRNKKDVLAGQTAALAGDQNQRPETAYYQAAVYNAQRNFPEGRKAFQRAVLIDPANVDAYNERANEALGIAEDTKEQADKEFLYATAKGYYEVAQVARPESTDALIGLAVVAMFQKKPEDAYRFAEAATKAGPNDPGAAYALAAATNKLATAATAAGRTADASRFARLSQESNLRAGQLDKFNLFGRATPDERAVWRYLSAAGRNPVLTAPK